MALITKPLIPRNLGGTQMEAGRTRSAEIGEVGRRQFMEKVV